MNKKHSPQFMLNKNAFTFTIHKIKHYSLVTKS